MSEDLLATVLTIAILAGIVLWVPLLNLVCPPCARLVHRVRTRPSPSRPPGFSAIGRRRTDRDAA